jgi:signal transduction histidine kinase
MRTRLRRRERPIRVLLPLIFIVPLASLVGLWGFAASVTASNAIQEHNFNSEDNLYGGWAQQVFSGLATERELAYVYLSTGRHMSVQSYVAAQHTTDKAVSMFEKELTANLSFFTSAARPAFHKFETELSWLSGTSPAYPGIRPEVAAGTVSPLRAFDDYNEIIDSEFTLYAKLVQVNNTPLYVQAQASVEAGRAVELASREATLAVGAAYTGQITQPVRVLFMQIAGNRQLLMTDALGELQPGLGSGYRRADDSPAYTTFTTLENLLINRVGDKGRLPAAFTPLAVATDTLPLFALYDKAQVQNRLALSSLGTSIGNRLLAEVGLAGGLGLIAIALSVFLMVRFGRRISRDLTGLQHAALDLAEERLPRVVARLGAGEDVDVAAEAAPLTAGRIAETARVAEAFSSVQRTAVEAAVGQARLRRGVSLVFRNLAWRSQSLLHRQLALLDAMERKQTEPETLDELFQLDHLTTRMRRHAEGLLILSDAPPGRGWRDPVVLIDVLRAAIAEIEEYKRVTVLCDSDDSIIGPAVADVIHLLAELIENAATYSPNTTEVTVRGERVANGFVVEVEDRGIGIRAEDLEAYNELLASPPEFDLADSNQLGLFVVARLAGKYRIRITLRRSPYGGTAAIVLLPHAIVATGATTRQLSELRPTEVIGAAVPTTALGPGTAPRLSGRATPAEPVPLGADGPAAAVPITGWADGPALAEPVMLTDGRVAAEPVMQAEGATSEPVTPADGPAPARPVLRVDSSAPTQPVVFGAENGTQDEPWTGSGPAWESGRGLGSVRAAAMRAAAVGAENGGIGTKGASANGASANGAASDNGTGDQDGTGPQDGTGNQTGEPAETLLPWLPRRRRQESLAPQLKIDRSAPEEDEPDDGPSPAGTRALVESLQSGLDRARMTLAEDSWPPPRAAETSDEQAEGPEVP